MVDVTWTLCECDDRPTSRSIMAQKFGQRLVQRGCFLVSSDDLSDLVRTCDNTCAFLTTTGDQQTSKKGQEGIGRGIANEMSWSFELAIQPKLRDLARQDAQGSLWLQDGCP